MTIEDLHSIFKAARQGTREWNGTEWVGEWHGDRAGVTAIVRALRDEFGRIMYPGDDWNRQGILEQFNEILGSDAAPAPQANTVELSQAYVSQIEQSRTEAHRNAAPAVCVWTSRGRNEPGFYSTPHGIRHMSLRHDSCVSCGNPIKFTEANHG